MKIKTEIETRKPGGGNFYIVSAEEEKGKKSSSKPVRVFLAVRSLMDSRACERRWQRGAYSVSEQATCGKSLFARASVGLSKLAIAGLSRKGHDAARKRLVQPR